MCNLKAELRRMVERAGGSKKAAEIADAPCSDMSLWTSDASSRFIPVDHLMRLDADARVGDLFLKEWARSRGYELVSLDIIQVIAPTVIKSVAELSRSSGELEFTTLEAAEDGHITPAERRRIQDCIAPVKDKISQLEKAIT